MKQKILFMLITSVCSLSISFNSKNSANAQRPSPSQIRTTRTDPNQGVILSEYLDEQTGRTIIVKAGTSQDLAVGWLKRLADIEVTKTEQDLGTLVTENHAQGLVAVSGGFGSNEVIVSWGPPPRRDAPAGTIVSHQRDQRHGTVIVAGPPASADKTKEWFGILNNAKSEADLLALLGANRPQGLLSATTYIKGGFKVTTFWSRAAR